MKVIEMEDENKHYRTGSKRGDYEMLIKVKGKTAVEILEIAKAEAGAADFVTLIDHDGEIKLNDVGDIAIPSGSKRSVIIEFRYPDLITTIQNFLDGN